MAIDLSDLVTGFQGFVQEQTQQAEQVSGMQAEQAERAAGSATLIREGVPDAQLVQETEQTALMNATNNAREFATAAGANMMDVSEIMTALGGDLRQTASQYGAAQDRVAELEANSNLLSNPLGWLNNLLNGDEARAELAAVEDKFQTTHSMIQGLNSATQQTAVTQQAIANTTTEATIAANKRNIARQAELDARAKEIEGLGYGIASINTLREQGAANFNNNVRLYNMRRQEEQWQADMEMRRAEFAQRQDAIQKQEEAEEYWTNATRQINAVRSNMDMPELDVEYVANNYNRESEQGQQLRRLHYMGFNAEETGEIPYGNTPDEALETLSLFGASLPVSHRAATDILEQAQSRVQEQISAVEGGVNIEGKYGITSGNVESEAALRSAYNAAAQEVAQEHFSQSGVLDTATIYQNNPELEQSAFGQQVLSLLQEQGSSKPDPEQVFTTGVAALRQNKIGYNELINGMAEYFQTSAAVETAAGGYLQLGLPGKETVMARLPLSSPEVNANGRFNIRLNTDFLGGQRGGFGGQEIRARQLDSELRSRVWDLGDPQQLTTALQLILSQERARELQRAVSGEANQTTQPESSQSTGTESASQ